MAESESQDLLQQTPAAPAGAPSTIQQIRSPAKKEEKPKPEGDKDNTDIEGIINVFQGRKGELF